MMPKLKILLDKVYVASKHLPTGTNTKKTKDKKKNILFQVKKKKKKKMCDCCKFSSIYHQFLPRPFFKDPVHSRPVFKEVMLLSFRVHLPIKVRLDPWYSNHPKKGNKYLNKNKICFYCFRFQRFFIALDFREYTFIAKDLRDFLLLLNIGIFFIALDNRDCLLP